VTPDPAIWWYLARATGITAWALAAASLVAGLLVSLRVLRRPTPAWGLDLHRFLGAATIAATAAHVGALVADNTVHFGWSEALVPWASAWRPAAVAWGVVAAYLLVAVELTSLIRRRLPRRVWRAVHMSSYAVFGGASVHLETAGTDAASPALGLAVHVVIGMAVALTLARALAAAGPRRVDRQVAPQVALAPSVTDRSA
jgi:methionine sulfoxide reductase heme-binding subunit